MTGFRQAAGARLRAATPALPLQLGSAGSVAQAAEPLQVVTS